MRLKIRTNYLLALFIVALVSGIPIALAGSEGVYTTLNFNIAAVDELSVKLLLTTSTYDAAWTTSSSGGTALSPGMEFNSSDGNTAWDNPARIAVDTAEQSDGYPILKTQNTGTTTCEFNISIGSGLNACQKLKYSETWQADPESGGTDLDTTPVQFDASFTTTEQHNLYLWGNFTNCGDADDTTVTLFLNISC